MLMAEKRRVGRPKTRLKQEKENTITVAVPHEIEQAWTAYTRAAGISKIKLAGRLLRWFLEGSSENESERTAIRLYIEREEQRHETWLREAYAQALRSIANRLTPVARADFADAMNDEPNERGSHANPGQRYHKDSRSHR
jgi:hypothetical protein